MNCLKPKFRIRRDKRKRLQGGRRYSIPGYYLVIIWCDKDLKEEFFDVLNRRDLKFMIGIKKNLKNKLIPLMKKILLRKRSIIETVFSVLKYSFELDHTIHRSIWNAFVDILSTLVAYC